MPESCTPRSIEWKLGAGGVASAKFDRLGVDGPIIARHAWGLPAINKLQFALGTECSSKAKSNIPTEEIYYLRRL